MAHAKGLSYHLAQFKKPYRSTEVFYRWLRPLAPWKRTRRVIDIASGAGSNLCYFASRQPAVEFIGLDNDLELVAAGQTLLGKSGMANARLARADLYRLTRRQFPSVDGLLCLQTLSWLAHYERAMRAMLRLRPRWIALSSLFYEGLIDAFITLHNYYRPVGRKKFSTMYYNVYSLERFIAFLKSVGYGRAVWQPFAIDIDLPRTTRDVATYTERLARGHRLQLSGPLLLPWYFVYAERNGT